jgi:hypothetical protein
MTRHLNDDQIAAVLAGLELEPDARAHLDGCVGCRREVAVFDEATARRRDAMLDDVPDFEAQRRAVMARIPGGPATLARRGRSVRGPVLALAAAVLIAVGVTALWPDKQVDRRPADVDVPVARILEETEALLSDDAIPGFEPIQWDAHDLELGTEVPTPSTTS